MTNRCGLYFESVRGTKVCPKEPVPPVIRIDELLSIAKKNGYLWAIESPDICFCKDNEQMLQSIISTATNPNHSFTLEKLSGSTKERPQYPA